ncbi:MAG: TauD/TfdA dioxygenase family protein [Burkholderiales bacterium]
MTGRRRPGAIRAPSTTTCCARWRPWAFATPGRRSGAPTAGSAGASTTCCCAPGLSEGLKETLAGLRAWHSSRHVFGHGGSARELQRDARIGNPELATQDALHPVVIRHPTTGCKALYVNASFTVRFDGWTEEESRPLLDSLYRHAARPELTCRFRWQAGSIAF